MAEYTARPGIPTEATEADFRAGSVTAAPDSRSWVGLPWPDFAQAKDGGRWRWDGQAWTHRSWDAVAGKVVWIPASETAVPLPSK